MDVGRKRLVDHLGGHVAGIRIAVAPGSGAVPHVLDTQRLQAGQDFRRHIIGIDRAEQILGHGLDDLGPFRIAIGKPAQDDERVVAAQRMQDAVEIQGAYCRRATTSLAYHR